MFKFFSKTVKQDDRDIEQVLVDISENHNKDDYKHLYTLLKDEEVFIPVPSSSIPEGSKTGEKYIPESTEQLKIKSILGPNDQPLVPAATKSTCAMLRDSYLSMNWIDFLNLVQKTEDTDGTFLEGETSWVRLDKERINNILNFYTV